MKRALLIVDMLNDFVQEDGKLPVPGAKDIVENIGRIKGAAGQYDMVVVYANDAHTKDDPEFKAWPEHAVAGTYGAKVVKELTPRIGDLVIPKQDLSVFTNSKADYMLREAEIHELYVTGVATEYCVKGAVLDALAANYKVNIVVDAIAGVDLQPGDQYKALIEMGNKGARPVTTKQALEEMLK